LKFRQNRSKSKMPDESVNIWTNLRANCHLIRVI